MDVKRSENEDGKERREKLFFFIATFRRKSFFAHWAFFSFRI
jgi:hypothetical protein